MITPRVTAVIIGRNEGERLRRCLESLNAMAFDGQSLQIIYADSGSSDDSCRLAQHAGATVLTLDSSRPCAAKGRNLGYRQARAPFIFFADGDTVIHPRFLSLALDFLECNPQTAIVWGHRRETRPEASIYNRVLDLDWIYPPGKTAFCGGDALMRKEVLDQVGPFREDLIAGEEPELCNRITAAGYEIMHLDIPMTGHDLAIDRFGGYWRRCFRAGYAYARVARMTGGRIFGRESLRNHLQGALYLAGPILLVVLLGWYGLLVLGAGAILVLTRTYLRARWRGASRVTTWLYALHGHFAQIPIWFGQLRYLFDRLAGRDRQLIEYKQGSP